MEFEINSKLIPIDFTHKLTTFSLIFNFEIFSMNKNRNVHGFF